uniref:Butyrophilin subfamily 3 member A2-like Ig-C domain-containing protein n=1 Tax=Anabas testudineus TaxID=64144 RepID=A0A3Q1JS87_ANATE
MSFSDGHIHHVKYVTTVNLKKSYNVVSKSLEWGRLDLEPRFVHVWHEGQNLLVNQNPAYRGRTSLSTEKLKHGDLSLSLSALKHSDNGQYRCYFPSQGKTSTVELLVGKWTSEININSSIVVLQCESKGWYPEPELLWLDAEGKILSAGPTETVRGPDDLYTVSSRVTVEKRHSKQHHLNINQTRETQIEVTEKKNVDSVKFALCCFVHCDISIHSTNSTLLLVSISTQRQRFTMSVKLNSERKSSCWQKTR